MCSPGLRRWLWAAFAASLAVSVVALLLFGVWLLFLVLPLFPFVIGGRRRVRRCPRCGWQTSSSDLHYCPRDGTLLVGEKD